MARALLSTRKALLKKTIDLANENGGAKLDHGSAVVLAVRAA